MKMAMFFLDVSDGRSFSRESVQTCRTKNAVAFKIPVCQGLCFYELTLCDVPSIYNSCKDHDIRRRVPLKWSPPSFYSALGGAAGNARWGFLLPKRLGQRCKRTVCGKPHPGPTPCRVAQGFFCFNDSWWICRLKKWKDRKSTRLNSSHIL